ncbi:hydantoinase/oxoprolinase family protein [SAR202 cluster bacterium AD-804-J14_MRT_500m]|nr:hydantoinase/oxoprolinase family protein [SAR202 cluster bacterium AD-804-J14_MRT_500m]
MRIGVDVGGTNTDAVLMSGTDVLSKTKTATTPDVSSGIITAVDEVLQAASKQPDIVQGIMIGTTQFTNAVVERKGLSRTAVIRLCLPATTMLPPLVDWPSDLKDAASFQIYMLPGGHEFDGRPISELDEANLIRTASQIRDSGVQALAICSVFSPVDPSFEEKAAALIREEIPGIKISLSHEIGRIGLLERENAAALNACLSVTAEKIVIGIGEALAERKLDVPVFWSQNDGTLMDSDFAVRYPVLTVSSGPTNSMRGAAFLSDIRDGAVVDVGGTTTDVGMLVNGFPREASTFVTIGGVRTNFQMPDVFSFALGGGSLISQNPFSIGPESLGYRLNQDGLTFGGTVLTATDCAVASGMTSIGDPSFVKDLDSSFTTQVIDEIQRSVSEAVDRMKVSTETIPVVLVGGGSVLLRKEIEGASDVIRPEHFEVANAIGAAIAQVGGQVDKVYSLVDMTRDEAISQARTEAVQRSIDAGARASTVEIVQVDEVPLTYLPSNVTRIRVKAVGELAL